MFGHFSEVGAGRFGEVQSKTINLCLNYEPPDFSTLLIQPNRYSSDNCYFSSYIIALLSSFTCGGFLALLISLMVH